MVRPDDYHHALRRANAFHLSQSPATAMRLLRGEHGAGNDELRRSIGHRKRIKESGDDPNLCQLMTARPTNGKVTLEFPGQDFTQWGRGFNGRQVIAAAQELKGQAPATGADLDDSFHVTREPLEDIRMQTLSDGQAVVKLGFQAVEQLPGEAGIALWVGPVFDRQSTTLIRRDSRNVFPRISLEQPTRADPISRPHCTRPSSSPFRTPGRCGGNSQADAVAADPRTRRRDFPRSECGRATTGCRYSGCDDRPAR